MTPAPPTGVPPSENVQRLRHFRADHAGIADPWGNYCICGKYADLCPVLSKQGSS